METVHIEAIQNYIDVKCSITLEQLKKNLLKDFNINVSKMTICRYIKSFNYTFKSLTLQPERRNDQKSINDRETYAAKFYELIAEIDESRIYFVDEVGFNVSMRSKRGRSLKGNNAVQTVPGIRSRNISVCCSMTKECVTKYNVQTYAYNTLSFNSFMSSLFEYIEKEKPGNSAIVLDNVAFHKNKQIHDIVKSKGHTLLFLPPYSPFLNPIENMFSKWKQSIRIENPNNESELFDLIENVNNLISSQDCAGFYRNMHKFLPKCLKRLAITEA